ncbi:MAG: S8 family serine peptidase [Sedimentisphaerales bacterium]|nr:S8 family serine peptidase [Sedimentisphaerales bacterium]
MLLGYDVDIRGADGDAQCVADGIRWAVSESVHVISMSFTARKDYVCIRQAVERALNSGCFLVAAAGNEPGGPFSGSTVRFPARYDSVIAVGSVALTSDDPSVPLKDRVQVSGLSGFLTKLTPIDVPQWPHLMRPFSSAGVLALVLAPRTLLFSWMTA